MHMDKLSFKFNHKLRYSIRKTTSFMKNRPAHRGQITGTSKEIFNNSFSNNISITDAKLFSVQNSRFFMRIIKSINFFMLLPLSLSMITSPISDMMAARGKQKGTNRKEKGNGERGRIKWQGWSGGEENERKIANKCNARDKSLWWVLGMSWLMRRSPRQRLSVSKPADLG